MNPVFDLGPDHVAVQLDDLMQVLQLLNQSKTLHDRGIYEAHKVQEEARLLLAQMVQKATE